MNIEFHFYFRENFEKINDLEVKNGVAHFFTLKSTKDKPNQDGLGLIKIDNKVKVLFVADGMGGHSGGDRAVETICQTFKKCFTEEKIKKADSYRSLIVDCIEKANQNVKDLKIGAGSTLTVAEIGDKYVQFYNCGDSTAFLLGSRGKFKYKTIEHSPVGYGKEAGIIVEGQEEAHGLEDNILSNGIGFEPMRIEISEKVECAPNDLVLLMTDGVHKNFKNDEIIETATEGAYEGRAKKYFEQICHNRETHLDDDNTMILFKCL